MTAKDMTDDELICTIGVGGSGWREPYIQELVRRYRMAGRPEGGDDADQQTSNFAPDPPGSRSAEGSHDPRDWLGLFGPPSR
jgi:hypothetical protein